MIKTVPLMISHIGATTDGIPSLREDLSHHFGIDPRKGLIQGMPESWNFSWDGVKCSIMNSEEYLYIRVHHPDATTGDRVLREMFGVLWAQHCERSKVEGVVRVWVSRCDGYDTRWKEILRKPIRDMSTVYLDQEIKDRTITQLRKFLQSKELYDHYGATWKRVHLFEGPPGTGKTSFIFALASLFERNLAKLTVTPKMTSSELETLISKVPENSFLLVEDVDALFDVRKAASNVVLDFSTFINCLDGVSTCAGLVVFLTTNHSSHLDPALLRPGRIDMRVNFTCPGRAELTSALAVLGSEWKEEHESFLNSTANLHLTVAMLQQYLFDCHSLERKSILSSLSELHDLTGEKPKQVFRELSGVEDDVSSWDVPTSNWEKE